MEKTKMRTDSIRKFILKSEDNLGIAATVIAVWPEVRQQIVGDFFARLEARLKIRLKGWQFYQEKDRRFFVDSAAGYCCDAPGWGDKYSVTLLAAEHGSKMYFGICHGEGVHSFSDKLLKAIKKRFPTARVGKPGWEAVIYMKSPASDWQKHDVLWQMNKDSTFLDDVAEQLLDLAKISKPIIDGLVQKHKK